MEKFIFSQFLIIFENFISLLSLEALEMEYINMCVI